MNRTLVYVGAIIATLCVSNARAEQQQPDDYFKVGSMSIQKIDQYDSPIKAEDFLATVNNCDAPKAKPFTFDGGLGDITIDMVINLAQKAWAFIEANKAVATVQTQTANALPSGVTCWNQLSNWQAPRSEVYQVSYKNLLGMTIVDLQFALVYAWGGKINGQGAYLTNATVQYRNLYVAWGWKLNADVSVPMVTNMGTSTSPVAGMEMSVNWSVDALTHQQSTASFYMSGDGRPTQRL